MPVQPFDSVIQLILGEVIVFGIVCLNLASVNRYKSPIYCSGKTIVKLMENLFEAIDVVFSKIGYGTKIRLYSAHHPFHFQVDLAAFCQFSGRADPFSTSINV